tara:strand:+ start:475 stop:702 length:228 start_codon:yes stop_codon:yes gene_type:complete
MTNEKLTVLVGMPDDYWDLIGEKSKDDLLNPHPDVRVLAASEAEAFAEKAPEVDGIMVIDYAILAGVLKQGSRLR